MKLLITGGLGFIGSNFIKLAHAEGHEIKNLDSVTYAANFENIPLNINQSETYHFKKIDITDQGIYRELEMFMPDWVVNFAAESHVDNSIENPNNFINTNINGTLNLLNACLQLKRNKNHDASFFHISTDEVYGSLSNEDKPFTESNPYKPNSPYSASKAASDHLVRAWHKTYGLKTIISNCSNNYGPNQHHEKLIPKVLKCCKNEEPIPVYGNGLNIRDWIYAEDHCEAILKLIKENNFFGETFNIGSDNEKSNLDLIEFICSKVDERFPIKSDSLLSRKELIKFVNDRPGHDNRYAIDSSKIANKIGWKPRFSFDSTIENIIDHYFAK